MYELLRELNDVVIYFEFETNEPKTNETKFKRTKWKRTLGYYPRLCMLNQSGNFQGYDLGKKKMHQLLRVISQPNLNQFQ